MKRNRVQFAIAVIAVVCLLASFRPASAGLSIGQYYQGGIIIKLSGTHGICATTDSMGKCVNYQQALVIKQNCHSGGFSNWRIPTKTELDNDVYPHRNSIPGVLSCPRPNLAGNGELLPPYCIPSNNYSDCKCNYWSSDPAGAGAQQQASFYSNGVCDNSCPQNDYCHLVLVRDF